MLPPDASRSALPAPAGFTLVELVVTLLTLSILAIGLVQFIFDSSQGYVQTAARNQVSAAGRLVIDRLAMDLHNAIPESVRVSAPLTSITAYGNAGDQCIEFMPIAAATTYRNPAFRPAARKAGFKVVDFVPSQVGVSGLYAVIYPTATAQLYGASFSGSTTEAIAAVSAIADSNPSDGLNEITTATTHRFLRTSPVDRLYLATTPVSYCLSGNRLYRYSDYGIDATQRMPQGPGGACASTCLPATTPQRALISDQLDNSALTGGSSGQAFDIAGATRRRNAVIHLDLNFVLDGQTVRLNHEILQQNTP